MNVVLRLAASGAVAAGLLGCSQGSHAASSDETNLDRSVTLGSDLKALSSSDEWPAQSNVLKSIQRAFDKHHRVSAAVHYVRLRDILPEGDARLDAGIELLTGYSPTCVPLARTAAGIEFKRSNHKVGATAAQESHVGQVIGTLAELNLPMDTPIRLGEEVFSLDDVIEDLVANYYDGRFEIEWTAIALARYWSEEDWTNRHGEICNHDRLVKELLLRVSPRQSCGGAHILQALAMYLRCRADQLSGETLELVERYIDSAFLSGSGDREAKNFRLIWDEGVPRLSGDNAPSLLVVGHSMELLMELRLEGAVDYAPSPESVRWLMSQLEEFDGGEPLPLDRMCEVTHAFRAVSLALQFSRQK